MTTHWQRPQRYMFTFDITVRVGDVEGDVCLSGLLFNAFSQDLTF